MQDDFISAGEFGRWCQTFQHFETELNKRLEDGFGGLHDRLDQLNSRTRKNEEAIASIKAGGCGQLTVHQATLNAIADQPSTLSRWKRPAQTVGAGAVLVALVELLKIVLERLSGS